MDKSLGFVGGRFSSLVLQVLFLGHLPMHCMIPLAEEH